MVIGHEMINIKIKKETLKILHLNTITINMYSSVIYNPEKKVTKLLVRAKENIRELRVRPENTKKSFDVSLIIKPKEVKQGAFAEKLGFFAK